MQESSHSWLQHQRKLIASSACSLQLGSCTGSAADDDTRSNRESRIQIMDPHFGVLELSLPSIRAIKYLHKDAEKDRNSATISGSSLQDFRGGYFFSGQREESRMERIWNSPCHCLNHLSIPLDKLIQNIALQDGEEAKRAGSSFNSAHCYCPSSGQL